MSHCFSSYAMDENDWTDSYEQGFLTFADYEGLYKERINVVERGLLTSDLLNVLPEEKRECGALRYFLAGNNTQLVERALVAGADPNYDDGINRPLDVAWQESDLKLLFQYGADITRAKKYLMYNIVSMYTAEWNASMRAINEDELFYKAKKAMDIAVSNGVDIHAKKPLEDDLLCYVVKSRCVLSSLKKRFLQYFIHKGLDNHCIYNLPDVQKGAPRNSENSIIKEYIPFIEQERKAYKWSMIKPFFVAICKEQQSNCYVSKLPQGCIRKIEQYL